MGKTWKNTWTDVICIVAVTLIIGGIILVSVLIKSKPLPDQPCHDKNVTAADTRNGPWVAKAFPTVTIHARTADLTPGHRRRFIIHWPHIRLPKLRIPVILAARSAKPEPAHNNSDLPAVITSSATEVKVPPVLPRIVLVSPPIKSDYLRIGIGKDTRGEAIVTYDIFHRDVAVKPLGFRLKAGEWGVGLFVAKKLGGQGYDAGPQANYQAGRVFVGAGYEVRNRTGMLMLGRKF